MPLENKSPRSDSQEWQSVQHRDTNKADEAPKPARIKVLNDRLTFSNSEITALTKVIEQYFGANATGDAPTPRFVRSFLFKYQLARMLLQMTSRFYEPQKIAEALARTMKGDKLPNGAESLSEDLMSIAEQVA
jgi:hypothetical protein